MIAANLIRFAVFVWFSSFVSARVYGNGSGGSK